ncbi:tRNA (guanosine(37)-N1)-methyltransferase TrmD [Deinococcus yavapaiensis]|uniref:tRNA (guanine-N(1)-)-methyltransferase n=1 Tax=Deinococcus yavapaiensis KR-236 TaxID=694435 RepID=A0A318S419_9DEIO|nr:tRNA (guanosine(37)-N1)-methyltransferase TrmD [Deinococcus yavapaiensis]PYE49892.1 tRNA (guanine37-N(1)-) methyltransferase [Deinococcus yavapaiensis KR-236]
MKFSLLTLFPDLVRPWTREALLGKAAEKGLLSFEVVDLRDFSGNRHRKVDDTPYGGGAGMVIRVDVAARALASIGTPDEVILLTPAGERFTQRTAEELALKEHVAILCGRYEGFDARVESLATREISLGDFVMMGGEAAAACLLESVARLVPGVIGDEASHRDDSFSSGLLDYPEFTRPPEFQGQEVPEVLLSGDHARIARWRRDEALARTWKRRPDLFESASLSPQDSATLLKLGVTPERLSGWGAPPPPAPKRTRRRKNGL